MITTPSQQTRPPTAIPLLAICPGYFMMILDGDIENVALVDIKEHLSANVPGLQWIVDGSALVFTSFLRFKDYKEHMFDAYRITSHQLYLAQTSRIAR